MHGWGEERITLRCVRSALSCPERLCTPEGTSKELFARSIVQGHERMSSVRLSTLQELMRRRRSIFVLAMCIACLSLRSVNACSVSDDFVFATHQDQWLAAAFVVEGTATEVDYDYDYDYDYDGGTTVLLTEDIATTKGSNLGCKTILVSGFTDSALCGLEPPAEGTTGTYYLCSLTVDENGDCTAEINSQGVFTGFTPAVSLGEADPSTAPSTCPQEPDVCQPVANCKPAPTPSPTPSPTPAPTPAPTPPPTPTSPVWPPTIDSECVNLDVQSSIRPTSDGSVAWLLSYNNVDRCFKKCRRPQGYTHIVEDRDTGKCFCYNAENSQEWEITEEDIGQEVLYSIEECFKMPTKRCPTDRPVSETDDSVRLVGVSSPSSPPPAAAVLCGACPNDPVHAIHLPIPLLSVE